jgi:hypothetical protein
LRVGGLAYACNDTLSEAATTDTMGPRLSAVVFRLKHARPGYFVVRWLCRRRRLLHDRGLRCADPLQHRRGQLGIVAWKVVNWQATPQQIAFAVVSTDGSSWAMR